MPLLTAVSNTIGWPSLITLLLSGALPPLTPALAQRARGSAFLSGGNVLAVSPLTPLHGVFFIVVLACALQFSPTFYR